MIGEAGIGKSRAIEALQEALADEPHARINLQCSPYHSDSALYPVIQYLGRAAALRAADTPEARIEKLGALFAQRAASDTAALRCWPKLLSIPSADAAPSSLTPAQRKAATLALLVDELAPHGRQRSGADRAGRRPLDRRHHARNDDAADRQHRPARLLAVVTARPDFAPPWLARPHATLVTLGRLGRPECAQLVAGVAAAHGLSAETVAAIVAKTDGIPLFVEELTKSVMELAGEDGAVPATLKDSLMARLDRLGEAREVAQIAAVIGRQFMLSAA